MSGALRVVVVLLAATVLYRLVPLGETARTLLYDGIATAALVVAWWAVGRRRPARRRPWTLVLGGHTAWVAGDLVWGLEQYAWGLAAYPAPSDALYLAGYGLLVLGVRGFARARGGGRDAGSLLDASIVAVGLAVPAAVFVVVPAAADSTISTLGTLVTSAYPVGDVLVLAVVVRLALGPGARSWSALALVASLAVTLVADVWWSVLVLEDPDADPLDLDVLWLTGYTLLAGAALHPSMHDLTRPGDLTTAMPRRARVLMLTGASLLPAATLLAAGLRGGDVPWAVIAAGGAVMALLTMARMAQLLQRLQAQATQLAVLARRDGLTGIPNRRTWDHELARACDLARTDGRPLSIAVLDLDHFKRYNDTHGHVAGDRLLQDAAREWQDALGDAGTLARYGGEEFALLLPGHLPAEAVAVVQRLRSVTPDGQTFSAGVAACLPGDEPSAAVAAADDALYAAKRAGRDRIRVADDGAARPGTLVVERHAR